MRWHQAGHEYHTVTATRNHQTALAVGRESCPVLETVDLASSLASPASAMVLPRCATQWKADQPRPTCRTMRNQASCSRNPAGPPGHAQQASRQEFCRGRNVMSYRGSRLAMTLATRSAWLCLGQCARAGGQSGNRSTVERSGRQRDWMTQWRQPDQPALFDAEADQHPENASSAQRRLDDPSRGLGHGRQVLRPRRRHWSAATASCMS